MNAEIIDSWYQFLSVINRPAHIVTGWREDTLLAALKENNVGVIEAEDVLHVWRSLRVEGNEPLPPTLHLRLNNTFRTITIINGTSEVELRRAILSSFGYNATIMFSLYQCNEEWKLPIHVTCSPFLSPGNYELVVTKMARLKNAMTQQTPWVFTIPATMYAISQFYHGSKH